MPVLYVGPAKRVGSLARSSDVLLKQSIDLRREGEEVVVIGESEKFGVARQPYVLTEMSLRKSREFAEMGAANALADY